MNTFFAHAATIQSAGYFAVIGHGQPAIQCATEPCETYSAPDWESLAFYAVDYALCECGNH